MIFGCLDHFYRLDSFIEKTLIDRLTPDALAYLIETAILLTPVPNLDRSLPLDPMLTQERHDSRSSLVHLERVRHIPLLLT